LELAAPKAEKPLRLQMSTMDMQFPLMALSRRRETLNLSI